MYGHTRLFTGAGLAILWLLTATPPASAQTSFAYKSSLVINNTPVTGTYDFQFTLYTAPTGGSVIGSTLTRTGVAVSSGVYTVTLDFGSNTFASSSAYLQIAYRKSGTTTYTNLAGRLQLTIRFSVVASSAMALQGRAVSSTAPVTGQALKWNGTQWAPGTDANTTYTAGAGLLLTGTVFSIATGGVTNAMLASNAVTTAKIADGSVTTGKIANLAVTGAKIADGAVTTTKVANNAITAAKVSWPFAYTGSSASTLFSITNNGTGYGLSGRGGQAGVTGTSNGGFGVLGSSPYNHGVHGESTYQAGVYGVSSSEAGVHGYSSFYYGVRGESPSGWGVYGTSTNNVGVWGFSNDSYGVHGRSINNDGVNGYSVNGYGVVGSSDYSYAGYFYGILAATDKRFQIDHPLDPANLTLSHGCIESSERLNVYSGNVILDNRGEARVSVPDWMEALNNDFRYHLTAIGAPGPNLFIAQEIPGNHGFTIAGGTPGMKVSWQVTGVRHDAYAKAHPLEVEQVKPDSERGLYLHPKEHGQPESLGIFYTQNQRPPSIQRR